MPFPAFYADNLSAALPFLQTTDWDSHFSRKRFLTHPKGFPVCPDASGLSVVEEVVELVQEVCHGNIVEPGKPLDFFRIDVLRKAFFDSSVHTRSHSYLFCDFRLYETFAVPKPEEPVRDVADLFVFPIPLIELCWAASGLQV